MLKSTNFFSRAFNRIVDDLHDEVDAFGDLSPDFEDRITDTHRNMSCQAIQAFSEHVLKGLLECNSTTKIAGKTPRQYFAEVITVREWAKAERVWAEELDKEGFGIVMQDGGKSNSFYYAG